MQGTYFGRTEDELKVEVCRDQREEEDTETQPRPQPRLTLGSGPIRGEYCSLSTNQRRVYCSASTNDSSPGPGAGAARRPGWAGGRPAPGRGRTAPWPGPGCGRSRHRSGCSYHGLRHLYFFYTYRHIVTVHMLQPMVNRMAEIYMNPGSLKA